MPSISNSKSGTSSRRRRKSTSPSLLSRKGSSRSNSSSNCIDDTKVPRNASGGVLVTTEEIEAAFRYLDVNGSGSIDPKTVKERMSILNRHISKKELHSLFGGQDSLNIHDIKCLLLDNELRDFDPVAESFEAALDPTDSGGAERDILKRIFSNLGFGDLTEEEMNVLVRAGDSDGDGRIGLEDFRSLALPMKHVEENTPK